jgi:anaerobic selenocysteine-containing dehydrogenase
MRITIEAISWEDAFYLIAAELNALQTPDEAVFYTSGRTSNEAAFLYQLLPGCSAQTTFPTVPTCAMRAVARG